MQKEAESTAPVKLFQRGDPLYVQAQQIWIILTGFVMINRYLSQENSLRSRPKFTIPYFELASIMNRPGAQNTLARQLGIVGYYCISNDLPALNVIVVNKNSGLPGDEVVFPGGRTVQEEMHLVGKFDWFAVRPPTIGALRKVYDTYKPH